MTTRTNRLRPLGPATATWSYQGLDEAIALTAQGAIVFLQRGLAMVADLHLGKTQTLRQHGLAVPEGSDEETLEKLEALLSSWPLKKLVILGDLIHHQTALDGHGRLLEKLIGLRRRWPGPAFHLVLGNHDRMLKPGCETPLARDLVAALDLQRHSQVFVQEGLRGYHDIADAYEREGVQEGADEQPEPWQVSGHLHPAVRLRLGPGQWQRLACFTRSGRRWMLPAFGAFTGGFDIQPADYDEIVGLLDGQLLGLG